MMEGKKEKDVQKNVQAPQAIEINVASDTDQGVIQISNNVVTLIVKKYAMEVPGVVRFPQAGALEGLFDVFSKRPVKRNIELDLQESGAIITLTLVLKFGCVIPEVCKAVQEMVKEKVETLSGYPVAKVDVNVVDLEEVDENPQPVADESEETEEAEETEEDGDK